MLTVLPVEIVEAKPVVRRQELREPVPLADTTIYEMERRGEFPKRFYLTPRCPVWDLGDVNHWLASGARPSASSRRRTRTCGDGNRDRCVPKLGGRGPPAQRPVA